MTYIDGVRGTGIDFDGTNDYLCSDINDDDTCDNDTDLQPTIISAGAWVKKDTSGYSPIIDYDGTDSQAVGRGYHLVINSSNQAYFRIGTGSGVWQGTTGTSTLNDGQWHHLVGTYQTGELKIYVDGKLETTTVPTSNGISYTNATFLAIGLDQQGSNADVYHDGKIDEPFVTGEALTTEQVRRMLRLLPPLL
jgi:hypothetical protein